jgi:osmotically-inducible protein OsmY
MSAPARTRTDDDVQRDVLEELRWDARLQPNKVGVVAKDTVVTLTGRVDSYLKKWAAERAAHRVRGVGAVANDIEVRLPSAAERNDSDIAAAVTRALEWDAQVPIERLDVTLSNGWVSLLGTVEWEYQRRAAERVVRGIAGVRGVTNLISVQPWVTPSPEELERRIEAALIRSAETDAERITVDVGDGRVVLKGRVRSWAERQEAERESWSAPGVTAVENHIVIES